MAEVSPVEFDHCRELVLSPGSIFEFTSRYLPAGKLEPLVALYALRQAIGTIPDSSTDDSVKWAKLRWWSEEIIAAPDEPSRHPILRALWMSGARSRLGNSLLLRLVSDAISQIDMAPDCDEQAMFERLAVLGTTEIQLELALDDAEIDAQSLNLLGAAISSFRLISDFSFNRQPNTERLPLSILAKYNVSATELVQKSKINQLTLIITQLAGDARGWFSEGLKNLQMSPESSAATHIQLRWAMENRRLNAIRQDVRGFLESGTRFGPADAWFAWRFLRKLK